LFSLINQCCRMDLDWWRQQNNNLTWMQGTSHDAHESLVFTSKSFFLAWSKMSSNPRRTRTIKFLWSGLHYFWKWFILQTFGRVLKWVKYCGHSTQPIMWLWRGVYQCKWRNPWWYHLRVQVQSGQWGILLVMVQFSIGFWGKSAARMQ